MCLTRKAGKNLTWKSVPTPCPSQDELCVLHIGDFHKRGGLWAAVTCWASLCQRLFSKAPRNKWVLVAALLVWISNNSSWQCLVGKEPRKITQEEFHADQPAVWLFQLPFSRKGNTHSEGEVRLKLGKTYLDVRELQVVRKGIPVTGTLSKTSSSQARITSESFWPFKHFNFSFYWSSTQMWVF